MVPLPVAELIWRIRRHDPSVIIPEMHGLWRLLLRERAALVMDLCRHASPALADRLFASLDESLLPSPDETLREWSRRTTWSLWGAWPDVHALYHLIGFDDESAQWTPLPALIAQRVIVSQSRGVHLGIHDGVSLWSSQPHCPGTVAPTYGSLPLALKAIAEWPDLASTPSDLVFPFVKLHHGVGFATEAECVAVGLDPWRSALAATR